MKYHTDFTVSEAPISYGGVIAHTPNPWSYVNTAGGLAYSTQSGTDPDIFDDGYAYLTQAWSEHYEVSIVMHINVVDAGFRECENLGRWSDTSTTISGIEPNVAWNGQYIAIFKLVGPPGTYANLAQIEPCPKTPVTGDVLKSRFIRNTVQTYINNELMINAIDDGTHGPILTGGKPGIGFYRDTASTNQDDVAASSLDAADIEVGLVGVRTQASTAALNATSMSAPPKAVEVGDALIVTNLQTLSNKQTISSVTDDLGNTLTLAGGPYEIGGTDDSSVTIWVGIATNAGNSTPSVNFAGTNTSACAIWYDTALGVDQAAPLSGTSGDIATATAGADDLNSGNVTPLGSRSSWLVYGFTVDVSAGNLPTATFGTGFLDGATGWDFGFGPGNILARAETKVVEDNTPVAATFTPLNSGDTFITVCALLNGPALPPVEGNALFFAT
jgi:hypothetical protein